MLSAVEAKGATPFGDRIRTLEIYSQLTQARLTRAFWRARPVSWTR